MCSVALICNVVLAFQQSKRSRNILASKVEIILPVTIEACSLNLPRRHFWQLVPDRNDPCIPKTFELSFLVLIVPLLQKKPGLVGPRYEGEGVSPLIKDPWLGRSGLSEDHFRSFRVRGGEHARDGHGLNGHGRNGHHAHSLHDYCSRLNIATHSC